MSDTDSVESFPDMIRRVLGDRLRPDIKALPEMFAVNGVMEMPYAPPGMSTRFEGRKAIAAHGENVSTLIELGTMSDVAVIESFDREVVVIEFAGKGVGVQTGRPYDQRYISVIRMCDGLIIHYTDYWNPLAVLRTLKGEEELQDVAVG